MNLFSDFDFRALENPGYSEDSVRKNIVLPILQALGYGPSGPHQMMPAKAVANPFVYLGDTQHKVSLIPDYLLQANGTNVFALGVTAPSVNIHRGEVPEQAFAYALHPEIRAFFYGLCNGRELCVYKWTLVEPVLAIPVADLPARWEELAGLLGPQALSKAHVADFLPDFGLSYLKLGADRNAAFVFAGTEVNLVARVDENTFTLTSVIGGEDDAYLGSFNFPRDRYEAFLACVPAGLQDKVRTAISEEPYFIVFTREDNFELIIHASLGGGIHTNEDEEYFPLVVTGFAPVLGGEQMVGASGK
jgi:hypothetical protein